ncbi:MAG: cell wall anchor protein, partial [Bacteroidales bacterium]|nr:cell wall anchor protein [Bacteroidales bacterium]
EPVVEEVRKPADEEALEALQTLKSEQLLSRGQYKMYQTRLVDILRVFIERTFNVPTMERTSDEILSSLSPLKKKSKDIFVSLQQILRLADFVKFAKYNPPVSEHEQALADAEDFVREATQWKNQQDEALKQENEIKK